MLNGEFSIQQAKALAGRLTAQSSDLGTIIRAAYDRVLCRAATQEDVTHAEFFVRQQALRIGRNATATTDGVATDGAAADGAPAGMPPALAAAIIDFCHALLNSAEFLNVE